MDASTELRFDGWTLQLRSGELRKGDHCVRLQRHAQVLLEALLERPGEVLSREELIARLWPKGVVDFDTALNSTVRRVRAALGDDADAPRYLETIPRRGYRFIGTLEGLRQPALPPAEPAPQVAAAPAAAPAMAPAVASSVATASTSRAPAWPRAWWLVALVLLAAGAALGYRIQRPPPPAPTAQPSLAVLPFRNLDPDPGRAWYADALGDGVLSLLARIPDLRVIAQPSAQAMRDAAGDPRRVARELGVGLVLVGELRSDGRVWSADVRLLHGTDGGERWSRSFEARADQLAGLPAEIAAAVATALQLRMAATPDPARDLRALEAYQRARAFFRRRGPGDLANARRDFEAALAIDSGYAQAWAGLASVAWIETTEEQWPLREGLEKVRHSAERALAIDPGLGEALVRLALYENHTGRRAEAMRRLRAAAVLDSNDPLVLGAMAGVEQADGNHERSIELMQRALAVDPLSAVQRHNLAFEYFLAGRTEDAIAQSARLLELHPGHGSALGLRALALVVAGRHAEALADCAAQPASEYPAQCRALALDGLGLRAEADAALAELIATANATEPVRIAEVYAQRGDPEQAFRWLEASAAGSEDPRFSAARRRSEWHERSPLLRPLHMDSRWQDWIASP